MVKKNAKQRIDLLSLKRVLQGVFWGGVVKTTRGFTLIELITVILILALLAVFAIPRYLAVLGDARKAVVLGVEAALQSAVALVKAKAKLEGMVIGTSGQTVELEKGLGGTVSVDITTQLVPTATLSGIGGKGPGSESAIDLRDTQNKVTVTPDDSAWPFSRTMTYAAIGAPGTCQAVYTEESTGYVRIETDVAGC